MLSDAHKFQFTKDGFFILENVLDVEKIALLKRAVNYLAETELSLGVGHLYSSTGKLQRVWNLLNKSSLFREIIQYPAIVDTMDWIFDRDTAHQKYYLSSFQANILSPGAEAQKWHLDTPVPEPHPTWDIKANTIWLLDDFTEANGATEVIPGSHAFNMRPQVADTILQTARQKVIAKAGSVIITSGMLWHRSGDNRSDQTRTVLLGSFAASYAREIANEENYAVVLDRAVADSASETLKRILGLDHGIRPGALSQVKFEIE